MTLQINAHYENGVFVPEEKVHLSEHQRVLLTVDDRIPGHSSVSTPPQPWDDPNDPIPDEPLALVEWFGRHRIKLDPAVAQDIIESDEYLDQEGDDEP